MIEEAQIVEALIAAAALPMTAAERAHLTAGYLEHRRRLDALYDVDDG